MATDSKPTHSKPPQNKIKPKARFKPKANPSKEDIFATHRKLIKKGVIKSFNPQKGYGFILSNETTREVFVHQDDIEGTVKPEDTVIFSLNFTSKGLIAKEVKLA